MIEFALDPALRTTLLGSGALLFGVSAIHKLREPAAFARSMDAYELVPSAAVRPLAALVSFAEIVIAAALLVPATSIPAALAGGGLLCVYSAAIAINLLRGRRHIDCGCLGPTARRPIDGGLLLRNGLLIALAVFAAIPTTSRSLVWLDAATVIGGVAVLAIAYAAFEQAALEDRAWKTH